MTEEQFHIVQHALGVDRHGQGAMYRNHYVGGESQCRQLVEMGFMQEYPPSQLTGGDPLFRVTDAGIEAMRRQSPAPERAA